MKYKGIITGCVLFLASAIFTCAQITTTVTTITPEHYSATARISVQKYNAKPDCEAPCEHCSLRNFYLAAGEVEKQILSVTTLNAVAERLDLAAKWQVNGEELLSMLNQKIQVRPFLSTSLISIVATSQDGTEAAAIANELAQVFHDDVEEQNRCKKEIAQAAADKELKAREVLVEQLKQKLQTLRKAQGFSESVSVDDKVVQKLQMDALRRDRHLTEEAMLAAEARRNKFSELKDKSKGEIAAFANDPFIDTLCKQIQQVEKQLSENILAFGDGHPEVKVAQTVLDELNKKWEQATTGMSKGLRAQYIISMRKFDALNQEIAKVEDAQSIIKIPELKQVRAEYDAQKVELDALKEKAFMIKYQRPDLAVEIIDFAELKPKSKPQSEFTKASFTKKAPADKGESRPELYRATSRISVLKRQLELLKCNAPCEHCTSKPSSSLRTETVMIKWSRPVLDEVAQRLDLAGKWVANGIKPSLDEVSSLLKRKLTVQQVGESSFIDITAESCDAAEAASIANEVARAYKKYVEGVSLKEAQRAEEALANVLKEQDDKVQQAELTYSELRRQHGLSGQAENIETRRARQNIEIQKSISDALKKRVSDSPPPQEKPPFCTVEIISIARVENNSK